MENTLTTLSDLEQAFKQKFTLHVADGKTRFDFIEDELIMLVAGLNAKIKKTRQSLENDIRNVDLETDQKVIDRIEYRKSEIEKYEALKVKIGLCQK